ncbi:unnamed protein product [Cylindrotheca closterium]|uniref:BPL/LPL catalytic domain-containing protein n=1 Tax=Cylindrotheca closterium TaxID=2856 RepID=A0AAD2CRG3_9STRA|nr:unnamed protein product [Cylindrotheca closterium]
MKISKLFWLDLRSSGISALERLSLEEALLRHDHRNWFLVGSHQPLDHKYLTKKDLPSYASPVPNPDCIVVMGVGGKPSELLNIPLVKSKKVLVTKRFSGGGTVVLDSNSIWTTFIGRNEDFLPHGVEPFPRSIMKWTADRLFGPAFNKLNNARLSPILVDENETSPSGFGNLGEKTMQKLDSDVSGPQFRLRENDYVLGDLKMGGNAQSIVKDGWLHHTSFLWDYEDSHMQYLMLPKKRPDYRGERSHRDFLVRLKSIYGDSSDIFVSSLHATCSQTALNVESIPLNRVMEEVVNNKLGGMDTWFEKCRTRILHKFD